MPKEKVTLTLDVERLRELREALGARSLSAAVEDAIRAHLDHVRHLAALDEWLQEMERAYGPVPAEDLAWAEGVVTSWVSTVEEAARAS